MHYERKLGQARSVEGLAREDDLQSLTRIRSIETPNHPRLPNFIRSSHTLRLDSPQQNRHLNPKAPTSTNTQLTCPGLQLELFGAVSTKLNRDQRQARPLHLWAQFLQALAAVSSGFSSGFAPNMCESCRGFALLLHLFICTLKPKTLKP